MEESHEVDHLLAAREILRSSIEKSRNIGIAVDQSGSRLQQTSHNLASLQCSIKHIATKCRVYGIRGHVDRAIGPAAALLQVLDLVHELHNSIQFDPSHAATSITRLQEALKLLADNCGLLILWLQDAVHILTSNAASADDWYLVRASKVVNILREIQLFCRDGGVVSSAFDTLENEYRRLLTQTDFSQPTFPEPELQAIARVLAANKRLHRCTSIHAQVRIAEARATLQALHVDYLGIQLFETDSVRNVETYINQWDNHMEFALRTLLLNEYRLCKKLGDDDDDDVWMNCFAKIATECGFIEIFDFGSLVCNCKKEAMKLLSLLKIFSTLDKLRLQFNQLFNGKFCLEIQKKTRALVKKVVNGASEIFWDMLSQVELQRETDPPPDGSVPRIVCFVTDYCNKLLVEENSSILTRVLEISQVWNRASFEQGLLSNEIHNTMKAVETNLESWAQSYTDTALSYLFMMNSHWYLCNNARGNKLGELMGKSWVWAYEESAEYYAALYLRESWEKLVVLLHEEGLTLFPGGRAINREVAEKRITIFCEAFDEMYKKQSKWILCDKALRWKTCHLIVEAVVPPYKSYLQRFMPGLEHEVNYTAERLEELISLLFQPKHDGSKCTDLIGMKNAAAISHFSYTPAAA
ncbi:hypothetical protein SASPL_120602 [Salvia splendens]|uniref:Exocyst subunit Exo70 family protein n=1 Tax=Salvia splendens TaxID=180675 RepID=A0A8X8XUW9_SALSN|nr:exocyst complex component EXO70I-like [Salvia splendens]KAG6418398.1 hypothetical protein SASPL_120602 [Salvia splendens]